jgi:hypothetical protein
MGVRELDVQAECLGIGGIDLPVNRVRFQATCWMRCESFGG